MTEEAATETTENTTEETGQETVTLKPEGLEESFWDAEKNEVRIDSLIKSHNDTRASVHAKEESLREKFMADLQKARPENPDAYKIPEDIGIELPEGVSLEFSDDDPLLGMWRNMAFENNLSNDQFMQGVRSFVETNLSLRPDPAAELSKLGENGQDRLNRIDNLLNKHLEVEEVNKLADFIGTADGVEILEKLVNGVNASSMPRLEVTEGNVMDKAQTRKELEEMMRDPRYTGIGRARDPAYINIVTQGFEKLFPGKIPTGQNR